KRRGFHIEPKRLKEVSKHPMGARTQSGQQQIDWNSSARQGHLSSQQRSCLRPRSNADFGKITRTRIGSGGEANRSEIMLMTAMSVDSEPTVCLPGPSTNLINIALYFSRNASEVNGDC